MGRQHPEGWLLLDHTRPCQAREHTPWQCLAVENVKSKAKVHKVREAPGRASLLDGASLCLDTCFSHMSCPPGGLALPQKPPQLLTAHSSSPQLRTPGAVWPSCYVRPVLPQWLPLPPPPRLASPPGESRLLLSLHTQRKQHVARKELKSSRRNSQNASLVGRRQNR